MAKQYGTIARREMASSDAATEAARTKFDNSTNTPQTRETDEYNAPSQVGKPASTAYGREPNLERALFQVPKTLRARMLEKLSFLYGQDEAHACYPHLARLMQFHCANKGDGYPRWQGESKPIERFSEKDAILICYGDMIRPEKRAPLKLLTALSKRYFRDAFNTMHILALFPYSSDRGFAITDFEQINPEIGSWEDLRNLNRDFRLIFDGVFNHMSSRSAWFQEYLKNNPDFQAFFHSFHIDATIAEEDLRLVVRPRTTDLLTPFGTREDKRLVWTTFGPDQVDLNFKNPRVLLKVIEILLLYVRGGCEVIRLDAVNYLWKELGTTCVHLPQSHTIIKLMRDVLDAVAPQVGLLTETNVSHEDNVSYFGSGHDEAQMVYNFALPPLVLHTFLTGNAARLTKWTKGLAKKSDSTTYLNFLDSHDGIGVSAAKGILTKKEIEAMSRKVREHGGLISRRSNGSGPDEPYEFNITWYSAINREGAGESDAFQLQRYLASRSLALVIMGVPAIYLDGLLGARNDLAAAKRENQPRSINRKRATVTELLLSLEMPGSREHSVFSQLSRMIRKRGKEKAFHPNAPQRVLDISSAFFTLLRTSVDGCEHILTITNVTDKKQVFALDTGDMGLRVESWLDVLSTQTFLSPNSELSFAIEPYGVRWLKACHVKRNIDHLSSSLKTSA